MNNKVFILLNPKAYGSTIAFFLLTLGMLFLTLFSGSTISMFLKMSGDDLLASILILFIMIFFVYLLLFLYGVFFAKLYNRFAKKNLEKNQNKKDL